MILFSLCDAIFSKPKVQRVQGTTLSLQIEFVRNFLSPIRLSIDFLMLWGCMTETSRDDDSKMKKMSNLLAKEWWVECYDPNETGLRTCRRKNADSSSTLSTVTSWMESVDSNPAGHWLFAKRYKKFSRPGETRKQIVYIKVSYILEKVESYFYLLQHLIFENRRYL